VKNPAKQPTPKEKFWRKKVLFICLGNACCSPMAESIARRDAADIIEACSAGLTPLGYVPVLTMQTLATNSYSIESLCSKPISRAVWDAADIVVNMSGVPKHLAFIDYEKVEDWDVQDPYGNDPILYQTIYEDIQRKVVELAGRFRGAARQSAPVKLGGKATRHHRK
jgi:protein-tyrosine-phosphatase